MLSKETRKRSCQQEKPKQAYTHLAGKAAPRVGAIFEEKNAEGVAHRDQRIKQAQNDRSQVGTVVMSVYGIVVAWPALNENDDRHEQLETLQRKVKLRTSVRLQKVASFFSKHVIVLLQLFADAEERGQEQKENSCQNVTVKYSEFQYEPQLVKIELAIPATEVEAIGMRYHVQFVVVRPENEVEVYRHFRDVKKLPDFVLVALETQCGYNVREHTITMCEQKTVLVELCIQKLRR
jgi:hypothetical protein